MKAPRLETRRVPEFAAELRERARAWIPTWGVDDDQHDFGRALLDVAARFSSEVAERLDRAAGKLQRGFLDFLSVRGEAARPARVPVVFKLAAAARDPVPAIAPVRMQADVGGDSVVFETETEVRLLPGKLDVVVGVDGQADAVYLPPPGLSDLEPLPPLPSQWQLKSFAAAGATTLQVDPETGLAVDVVLEADRQQYRITKVDKEIITIEPPLTADLAGATTLRKVTSFTPFDGVTRDRQEHALYLGQKELLDVESAATIDVVGAKSIAEGVTWEYWGKVGGSDATWQRLHLAPPAAQKVDAVVLTKEKGKVEPVEIDGRKSRWIRAYTKNVPTGQQPRHFDELALRINADSCGGAFPDGPSPAAEGMANTTPLMLFGGSFYPLGREPRQFDAFYLGCPEAFSKPGAEVQLHFELGNPSFESLACLRNGPLAHRRFAGVAGDGYLYLLDFDPSSGKLTIDKRGPRRPPSPDETGKVIVAPPIPLDPRPNYRTPMWVVGPDLFVAAATPDGVVWRFRDAGDQGGWTNLGEVGPVAHPATEKITGLVHLDGGTRGRLFAVREQTLFFLDLDTTDGWKPMQAMDGANTIALETIVPIAVQDSSGNLGPGTVTNGLAGTGFVGGNATVHNLYEVTFSFFSSTPLATCAKRIDNVTSDVAPAAVLRLSTGLLLAGVSDDKQKLLAWQSAGSPQTDEVQLAAIGTVGHSLDINVFGGLINVALCLQDGALSTALALWPPFFSPLQATLFVTPIPQNLGPAGGSPSLLPQYVLVPATSSQVLVGALDPNGLLTRQTKLETAVIASTVSEQLGVGDQIAIPTTAPAGYELKTVPTPVTLGTETLYEFDVFPTDDPSNTTVFAPLFTGNNIDVTLQRFTPAGTDGSASTLTPGTPLLITTDASTQVYDASFDSNTGEIVLTQPLDVLNAGSPPPTIDYHYPLPNQPRVVPLLHLDSTSGDWPATLLGRTYLAFPGADPERQRGRAFTLDPSNNGHPELVVLEQLWTTSPPLDGSSKATFIIDARVLSWTPQLGDPTANPSLSWEYANGTGWWKLDPVVDETQNLKKTGDVRFTVPDDLRPMDWAGRTSYWIRARLVGGDYGKEIITIKQLPPNNGETTQTIERSTAGIRAPLVTELRIAYRLCTAVQPMYVLAQDSRSPRDQSDANRTRGAVVEAFVPLAVAVGRLSNAAPGGGAGDEDCPPPCACADAHETAAAAATATAAAPAFTPATGRALFIGLSAAPSGSPVNVLLLVANEAPHDAFAPMTIEALVADRFVPVVADDTTRAIGESGILSMSFALPPAPRELFGFENLTWLKLTPRGDAGSTAWNPSLRGAYLNAVWARAAETLTRELLGSSEGAPNLTVFLARPPVLQDTLELRVREPLTDEERQDLLRDDATSVVEDNFVLWKPVLDPGDEDADARVYAFDEGKGEIRFGDGRHGRIPPIGRDSIVAFRYQRTELGKVAGAGVPGNAVAARTALNLVSPVESVEAVIAADQAAGGAPPEDDERVVRFGSARLRHRRRAVTASDFEDLALESSPDIVQARCFAARGGVRLVVVMRGADPLPNAAEVRELGRLLLGDAPASLAARDALRIGGPRLRRLRIALELRVASLDVAGEVSRDVEQQMKALFNTASWPLGAEPKDEDVARAIVDTPHLESLGDVSLREVLADGSERPWTSAVKRDDLVLLDKDPLRLQFQTVEVIS